MLYLHPYFPAPNHYSAHVASILFWTLGRQHCESVAPVLGDLGCRSTVTLLIQDTLVSFRQSVPRPYQTFRWGSRRPWTSQRQGRWICRQIRFVGWDYHRAGSQFTRSRSGACGSMEPARRSLHWLSHNASLSAAGRVRAGARRSNHRLPITRNCVIASGREMLGLGASPTRHGLRARPRVCVPAADKQREGQVWEESTSR